MGVHFPAAILEILVEMSDIFSAFLAHIYSGKVTKAFVTIISGFRAKDKKCVWGEVKYPPVAT